MHLLLFDCVHSVNDFFFLLSITGFEENEAYHNEQPKEYVRIY